MRIALLSDVHGNIYSFKEIIKSIKKQKVDALIFCGDICGYYYHQNEIIDILREFKNLSCVLGNHDKLFLDCYEKELNSKIYTDKYGKSIELLRQSITPKNLKFLKNLEDNKELFFEGQKIGVFHGSPYNYLEGYIYPDTYIDDYKDLNYDYLTLGHTHYQMVKRLEGKTIINPGSCGQPRDGNPPSYAILDLKKSLVKLINVEYDFRPLIKDIYRNKETNQYLTNILYRRKDTI